MLIRKLVHARRRNFVLGCLLAVGGAATAVGMQEWYSPEVVSATAEAPVRAADLRVDGGSLMIVGGGAVTSEIRRRFVELAGGPHARIVVIPAVDPQPGNEGSWLSPWRSTGAQSVELCHARDRAMANDPTFCAPLEQATGVWFSGGYQSLLADRYVDTRVQQCLHELLQRNGVVGGVSAGAALLSRVMIRDGDTTPVEARGLDLISEAVVDQHFLKRNRLWRLQQMLEAHPKLVGLGIDEATALVVDVRTWRMSVVGESYVLVCLPATKTVPSRIEVLHPGDDVSLSQLRQDHLAYHAPPDSAGPPIGG